MPAGKFIDTNIFLYSFASKEPVKKARAIELTQEIRTRSRGVTSFQVIQEFINVICRESSHRENATALRFAVQRTFIDFEILWPSFALYEDAMRIKTRYGFHWYDSLIVAATLEAKCDLLYTEDLQHDQRIEGLTVINPFL